MRKETVKERRVDIDLLKFIGLLCIILAHANPPNFIFQLRNFDVVLMILISGYLGLRTYKSGDVKGYIIKRFKRLVIPTWVFLTFFFIVNLVFNMGSFSLKDVAMSYALSNSGIGYVWIIRIYLIIALLIPVYKYLVSKIDARKTFLLSVIVFVVYEIICQLGAFNNFFTDYLFAYIAPCFLLLNISGAVLKHHNTKSVYGVAVVSFVVLLLMGLFAYITTGVIQPTQIAKYPFRSYYLSYGLIASLVLIAAFKKVKHLPKVMQFICNHSLWFYLWHILVIYILKVLNFNFPWIVNFILMILASLLIVYVQSKVVEAVRKATTTHRLIWILEG